MKKRLSLGSKIRYARKEAGFSQKELGQAVELSDKTISAYEVDRAKPGVLVLRQISRATDRPVTYFIDDDPARRQKIDFAAKIKKIEQELAEIKAALKELSTVQNR